MQFGISGVGDIAPDPATGVPRSAPRFHFKPLVDFYRQRFEHYGHGRAQDAIVGLGGQAFIARKSQDAFDRFRPYFESYPMFRGTSLEQIADGTPTSVGSPQQVIDKTLTSQGGLGDCSRPHQHAVVADGGRGACPHAFAGNTTLRNAAPSISTPTPT